MLPSRGGLLAVLLLLRRRRYPPLEGVRGRFLYFRRAMTFTDKFDKGDYYLTPEGYIVFTEQYHLKRGYCCQSDCRHCPYKKPKADDGGRPDSYREAEDGSRKTES